MAKNSRAQGAASLADIEAAAARLQSQTLKLQALARARQHLADFETYVVTRGRKLRADVEKAEADAREAGALALMAPPTEAPPNE